MAVAEPLTAEGLEQAGIFHDPLCPDKSTYHIG